MNKIIKWLSATAMMIGAMTFTSCSLEHDPINPQQTLELNADALFNKIYASFCLTGQTGASGNPDISAIDNEGFSEFYRMAWYLNEFTTDEASWVWVTDAGVPDLLHNTYDAGNTFSLGFYYRVYFTITLCNYYLDIVGDDGSDETSHRRAEVRFIRALNYYYLMDMFGNAAFTLRVSAEKAEYYTRDKFFAFVESELLDCAGSMAEPGANTYGRVDKVAAWNLLARLYLNAEVYVNEDRYADAMTYANKVIKEQSFYRLCKKGATNPKTGEVYSPYQMLFLADNNETEARYESLFPVLQDGILTQSYGAMEFLILSCYSVDMSNNVPSGTDNSWGKCTRVRGELVDIFFKGKTLPSTNNVKTMTDAAGDDRALFYSEGYSQWINDESDQKQGVSCVKFRNVRSDGASTSSLAYVDTDLPLMRIAEAYLTYAEAAIRCNKDLTTAYSYIDELHQRANTATRGYYELSDLPNEWAKEFWFEGRRRMDLVRFNMYGGQSSYKWQWMGGTAEGSQFASFRNIYAIPVNDLTNNSNLKQNKGYSGE